MASKNVLIYAEYPDDLGSMVVLNGVAVYYEDNDRGAFNEFYTARRVAESISKALKIGIKHVFLTLDEIGGENWGHGDALISINDRLEQLVQKENDMYHFVISFMCGTDKRQEEHVDAVSEVTALAIALERLDQDTPSWSTNHPHFHIRIGCLGIAEMQMQ